MPKPRKKVQIACTHFAWLLGQRGGVYVADGRSNKPSLGRHSLGTKDRAEALEALKKLDLIMAIKVGRADKSVLDQAPPEQLDLTEGWNKYLAHVARSRVTGGASRVTSKRYLAVGDKFITFARSRGITAWSEVTGDTLNLYSSHLEAEEYAYSTVYLELTTLKQVNKFLVEKGLIPAARRIALRLRKPDGTNTYCWTREEVGAIVDKCRKAPDLDWLGDIVVGLACTGLRISELEGLRWSDVNLETKVISLTDESTQAPAKSRRERRTTKSRRSRSFPIHDVLQELLRRIPRGPDGLVFHGADGARINSDTVRRVLVNAVLTPLANRFPTPVEGTGFGHGRLHSFRHYFCSVCADDGVPEQMLIAWLGHSNSKMIKRYYHLRHDEGQRRMKKVKFIPRPNRKRSAG